MVSFTTRSLDRLSRLSIATAFHLSILNPVSRTHMIRHLLALFLAVTVLFLLATISTPIAVGQETGPLFLTPGTSVRPLENPIRLMMPAPASAADPAHHGFGDVDLEPHWIVSIRHCRSNCRRCPQCCELDYFSDKANGIQRIPQSEFVSSLLPGVPVCIVVHGSYVTGDTVREDSLNTFHWLRQAAPQRPLHVVFFTWASEGTFTIDRTNALTSPLPGVDIAILGKRAELNGFRLAKLIHQIPSDNPVCLIGHSHGARMVASTLHLLAGASVNDYALRPGFPVHRIRTVLAAAAIDHDWLSPDERYGAALNATESLVSLKTRHDWALWFYPLRKPFSPKSLGRGGFTQRDWRELGSQVSQVAEMDVTNLVGIGHIWPHYYDCRAIAHAIAPSVYFADE